MRVPGVPVASGERRRAKPAASKKPALRGVLPLRCRRTLGALAEKCHAYAKALHYKELEYQTTPQSAGEAGGAREGSTLGGLRICLGQPCCKSRAACCIC